MLMMVQPNGHFPRSRPLRGADHCNERERNEASRAKQSKYADLNNALMPVGLMGSATSDMRPTLGEIPVDG